MRDDIANDTFDFIVHLGDHAYNMNADSGDRGDGYIEAFSEIISHTPWIPTIGNHEYYNGDECNRYDNQTHGGHIVVN